MAHDLPPLLPIEPISAAGARPVLPAAIEAELFAVAWFATGGHDALAARAVGAVRAEFERSHHGAVDPRLYALTLLVPRTRRLARGVRPAPTGDALLDDVFTASTAARTAVALFSGLGIDATTAGQLLGVDAPGCESLCRHARGAGRFVGVEEAVHARCTALIAQVVQHGLPAPSAATIGARRGRFPRFRAPS
jgi:hypothetical protein